MELRCLHGDFCSRLFNRGTRSTKKYIKLLARGQRPRPLMNLEIHPSRPLPFFATLHPSPFPIPLVRTTDASVSPKWIMNRRFCESTHKNHAPNYRETLVLSSSFPSASSLCAVYFASFASLQQPTNLSFSNDNLSSRRTRRIRDVSKPATVDCECKVSSRSNSMAVDVGDDGYLAREQG